MPAMPACSTVVVQHHPSANDTTDTTNPQVQELESGHIWWYHEHLLEAVPAEQVPQALTNPKPPGEQSLLSRNYCRPPLLY